MIPDLNDIDVPTSFLFKGVDPDKYRRVVHDLFKMREKYPVYRDDELLVQMVLLEREAFGRCALANHKVRSALRKAREAMRGKDLEHIWVNYPDKPAVELGKLIDEALSGVGP